jgi:hypothetical protein
MTSEFTTLLSPGPAFVAGRKLEEQAGFQDQVTWWKEQQAARRMKLIGNPSSDLDSVVIVEYADTFERAHGLATSAPLVASGVLVARTFPGGVNRCAPPRR